MRSAHPAVMIMAKAPAVGESKTRMVPPLSYQAAAALAEAALSDTIDAVAATPGIRPLVALLGEPGPWLRSDVDLISQRGNSLSERLAAAFEDAGGPALAIDGDTPQVTPDLLEESMRILVGADVDAVLGPARDGGYWAIGLRRPDPEVFRGVPMSRTDTCRRQRGRLLALGLAVSTLPELRDADGFDDALAIAALIPRSRFAAAVEDAVAGLETRGAKVR